MNNHETEKARWLTLGSGSSGNLTTANSVGTHPQVAAGLATRMLSCYRASEASDPDVFIAEAASVMCGYPEDVVQRVSYGMPSKSKWLPSIAEIREACDAENASNVSARRRESERAHTERVVGRTAPPESAEHRKRVADEMRARFANLGKEARDTKTLLDPRGLPEGPARREVEANLAAHIKGLAERCKTDPPVMSAALRASLGITRQEDAA